MLGRVGTHGSCVLLIIRSVDRMPYIGHTPTYLVKASQMPQPGVAGA
ncbi:MAG: hypothetical protein K2K78_05150 [Muribaculaceae bacterium]|nr:hypothetical protein [Muribaculaceae bacterium]